MWWYSHSSACSCRALFEPTNRYTPKEPEMISPQSMMVQDDNTIYAVERTGSGAQMRICLG